MAEWCLCVLGIPQKFHRYVRQLQNDASSSWVSSKISSICMTTPNSLSWVSSRIDWLQSDCVSVLQKRLKMYESVSQQSWCENVFHALLLLSGLCEMAATLRGSVFCFGGRWVAGSVYKGLVGQNGLQSNTSWQPSAPRSYAPPRGYKNLESACHIQSGNIYPGIYCTTQQIRITINKT